MSATSIRAVLVGRGGVARPIERIAGRFPERTGPRRAIVLNVLMLIVPAKFLDLIVRPEFPFEPAVFSIGLAVIAVWTTYVAASVRAARRMVA